jgi:hypothetical protein
MLELYYVLVMDGPMDFDLTHELLFCPALSEGSLLHNLGCTDLLGFLVDEFIAFSEASFP